VSVTPALAVTTVERRREESWTEENQTSEKNQTMERQMEERMSVRKPRLIDDYLDADDAHAGADVGADAAAAVVAAGPVAGVGAVVDTFEADGAVSDVDVGVDAVVDGCVCCSFCPHVAACLLESQLKLEGLQQLEVMEPQHGVRPHSDSIDSSCAQAGRGLRTVAVAVAAAVVDTAGVCMPSSVFFAY